MGPNMLSEVDCRAHAEQCLAGIAEQCGEDLVLMPRPSETSATLAYFYQTSEFIATRQSAHALAGNAPILVDKLTGSVEIAGTADPLECYLREFEAKNARSK